ncbi:glycosyltransferase family 39 protein [Cupriavidus metallidurans]|uniref:glycosyltransferase family 39 protein n=1 Tax=Cupriavidus metallidurans TaxID=119219 RepID=UPI000CE041D4|nr:glycosyltransferase family 39 protein [Cupriavidus metallidurans]AVA35812.1 glycosyl transferase [Cupriavidus metallidurans]
MKSRLLWFSLIVVTILLWTATLSIRPLYEPDEGRYAEVAREMYISGDWTTPRLNGIKFFDKPPLQYWATAAAFALFGVSEWSARLWSSLIGVSAILFAGWSATVLFGRRVGLASALVLAGSPLWILGSNLTTTDIGVGALLGSAVLVYAVAVRNSDRRLYPIVWGLAGLAFLAKGLIAIVLPAATMVVYAALTRQFDLFRRCAFWVWGLFACVLALPWIVAVSVRNPEFLNYFFVHEHLARFTSSVHARNKPAWFFAAVLVAGMLPWAGVIPATVWQRCRPARRSGTFDPRLFLLVWTLIVLVFFSVSRSKLPLYLLPAFPPLAVLVGDAILRVRTRWVVVGCSLMVILGILIAGLQWIPELSDKVLKRGISDLGHFSFWSTLTIGALVVGGLGACALALSGRRGIAVAVAALASIGSLQLGLVASMAFESLSIKPIGLTVKASRRADTALFNVGQIDRGLAFYSEMLPQVVVARDELDLGFSVDPQRWIDSYATFLLRWRERGHKLAVMREATFAQLSPDLGPESLVVARRGTTVLVEKR